MGACDEVEELRAAVWKIISNRRLEQSRVGGDSGQINSGATLLQLSVRMEYEPD